jgi:hypothetical protein
MGANGGKIGSGTPDVIETPLATRASSFATARIRALDAAAGPQAQNRNHSITRSHRVV